MAQHQTQGPFVEHLPNGYRRATYQGALLLLRPDGSEAFANVQADSGLYAAMNDAIEKAAQEVAA